MQRLSLAALVRETGPRRWLIFRRPQARRLGAVRELVRRSAADAAAADQLAGVWRRLLREQHGPLLAELAAEAGRDAVTPVAGDLIEGFSLDNLREDPEDVRGAVVGALASFGPDAAGTLIPGILDEDPTLSAWCLVALRRIGLDRAAGALAEWYQSAPVASGRQMARFFADVRQQSWEDVIRLLSGCLDQGGAGQSLAQAVLQNLDREQLERECLRYWTSDRMAVARALLIRCFDYEPASLM